MSKVKLAVAFGDAGLLNRILFFFYLFFCLKHLGKKMDACLICLIHSHKVIITILGRRLNTNILSSSFSPFLSFSLSAL